MPASSEAVVAHYQPATERSGVAAVLIGLDGLEDALSAKALAALDQFHAGGLPATLRLAQLLSVDAGAEVLDAGSGLGGPSRAVADALGCHVTGVDLTPRYVDLARELAGRTGFHAKVSYEVGDLLALRFEDGSFDAAYSQHVVMNIADRAGLYRQIRRVLKPGAAFAFHDVIAADDEEAPIYPTPWAESEASSFLLTKEQTTAALEGAGLKVDAWTDVTEESAAAMAQLKLSEAEGPTLASVMGARFPAMAANFARNLREGRVRLVMGRARAV